MYVDVTAKTPLPFYGFTLTTLYTPYTASCRQMQSPIHQSLFVAYVETITNSEYIWMSKIVFPYHKLSFFLLILSIYYINDYIF